MQTFLLAQLFSWRPSKIGSAKSYQAALRIGVSGVEEVYFLFRYGLSRLSLARSLVGFTFHRKGNFRWEEIKRNAGFLSPYQPRLLDGDALPFHQITAGHLIFFSGQKSFPEGENLERVAAAAAAAAP